MTTGRITANLPSRNFDVTAIFYGRLGFTPCYRDDNWMILSRQGMVVEFFAHPDLVPDESWFSACLRLPEIDNLLADWAKLGLPADSGAIPRLTDVTEAKGLVPRMFALIDPDGSLWRIIEDTDT